MVRAGVLLAALALVSAGALCAEDAKPEVPIPAHQPGALHPDWLDGARQYRIPAWLDQANRVHLHTSLGLPGPVTRATALARGEVKPDKFDSPAFLQAGARFRAMGADVYVRSVKSRAEPAWWPSKVGPVLPIAAERNVVKAAIDEAHAAGMRLIAYYRHDLDAEVARQHPDWRCVTAQGEPINKVDQGRVIGTLMCLNSPFADLVEQRLLELVDMGADGFYFDWSHQPGPAVGMPACACPACRANGHTREQIIIDTFNRWARAIHGRNPEAVLLICGRFEGESNVCFRLPAITKCEALWAARYGGGQSAAASGLGLAFLRDAEDGRPFHLWWSPRFRLKEAFAMQVLAYGGIFNFHVVEDKIMDDASDTVAQAKALTALGKAVSPALAGTRPAPWALLHYPDTKDLAHSAPALLPQFAALLQAGVPCGIITDSQLAEGVPDSCGMLALPDPDYGRLKDRRIAAALEAFQARGGLVLRDSPRPAGTVPAAEGWAAAAPVRIAGDPGGVQAQYFRSEDAVRHALTLWTPGKAQDTLLDIQRVAGAPAVPAEQAPGPVRIVVRANAVPQQVTEAVTGQALTPVAARDGFEVTVPAFRGLAVLSWRNR